ncbi:hypothetical protein [Chryseobacterium luquanense]|uniref:Uncharacterized protein n=1 Tax=Chryseobacterium luquanense TaxID=2983766 RepID=A0ABT3Y4M5_9FLAO|nr:hypothetical protein [Chryseobacterium luquanense]MCX8533072.1 hypothetical protein [Chryseobacterium luquanense]
MFTIKDLKKIIESLPDDMPVGLLDTTTDDTDDMNYSLSDENFMIEDCYSSAQSDEEYGNPLCKMLFITFENSLNEDPI